MTDEFPVVSGLIIDSGFSQGSLKVTRAWRVVIWSLPKSRTPRGRSGYFLAHEFDTVQTSAGKNERRAPDASRSLSRFVCAPFSPQLASGEASGDATIVGHA